MLTIIASALAGHAQGPRECYLNQATGGPGRTDENDCRSGQVCLWLPRLHLTKDSQHLRCVGTTVY